jgi:DNA repair exonuclease SbcCD nuclease subunit
MRFIHTADIHLDSPLRGLSAYPDAPADRLRLATREAFENLVTRAMEEAVDFMVIAGDVYDGDWKDFNTGLFFVRQMGRLRQAGIAVYLLYGNHDADSEMTRRLELPDNVHVFPSNRAGSHRINALKVALHGQSFKVAATTDNLAAHYPAPVPGWLNIGVLHTALEGNTAHASYAPCSIAELQARGYQYWALGHVHEQRLWQGSTTIAYPGNLQGRHIRETGPRGALLVTAQDSEISSIERLEVDVLRWHQLQVAVPAEADFSGAVRAAGRAMENLLETCPSSAPPLALRVVLEGATAAHAALIGQETQLRQEVLAQAVMLDAERLWIEKVRIATTPRAATGTAGQDTDSFDELQGLARQAAVDPEFLAALQDDLQHLLGRLPRDVLEAMPELQSLREGQLRPLVANALPLLLARAGQAG